MNKLMKRLTPAMLALSLASCTGPSPDLEAKIKSAPRLKILVPLAGSNAIMGNAVEDELRNAGYGSLSLYFDANCDRYRKSIQLIGYVKKDQIFHFPDLNGDGTFGNLNPESGSGNYR